MAPPPIESPAAVENWTLRGSEQRLRDSIEVRPLGHGWTLLVNVLGYRATDPHALRGLSVHGRAVILFEDVQALSSFLYASGGRVIREFDPLLYDRPWTGTPTPSERMLRFGSAKDFHVMTKCLVLLARITGVRLTLSDVLSRRGRIAVGVRD